MFSSKCLEPPVETPESPHVFPGRHRRDRPRLGAAAQRTGLARPVLQGRLRRIALHAVEVSIGTTQVTLAGEIPYGGHREARRLENDTENTRRKRREQEASELGCGIGIFALI